MHKSLGTLILLALVLSVTAVAAAVVVEAGPPGDNPVSSPPDGETPGPILPIATPQATPVVSLTARLYADEDMTQLFADIVAGHVYFGCEACGLPSMFFDGTNIYWGVNETGEVLFCVHGNRVVAGGSDGAVIFTFEGRFIYEGQVSDAPLYTLEADRLLAGDGQTGQLILRADRRLEDSGVRFLLPLLLELGLR